MSKNPRVMTTEAIFFELDGCFCDDVGQHPSCDRCTVLLAEYNKRKAR